MPGMNGAQGGPVAATGMQPGLLARRSFANTVAEMPAPQAPRGGMGFDVPRGGMGGGYDNGIAQGIASLGESIGGGLERKAAREHSQKEQQEYRAWYEKLQQQERAEQKKMVAFQEWVNESQENNRNRRLLALDMAREIDANAGSYDSVDLYLSAREAAMTMAMGDNVTETDEFREFAGLGPLSHDRIKGGATASKALQDGMRSIYGETFNKARSEKLLKQAAAIQEGFKSQARMQYETLSGGLAAGETTAIGINNHLTKAIEGGEDIELGIGSFLSAAGVRAESPLGLLMLEWSNKNPQPSDLVDARGVTGAVVQDQADSMAVQLRTMWEGDGETGGLRNALRKKYPKDKDPRRLQIERYVQGLYTDLQQVSLNASDSSIGMAGRYRGMESSAEAAGLVVAALAGTPELEGMVKDDRAKLLAAWKALADNPSMQIYKAGVQKGLAPKPKVDPSQEPLYGPQEAPVQESIFDQAEAAPTQQRAFGAAARPPERLTREAPGLEGMEGAAGMGARAGQAVGEALGGLNLVPGQMESGERSAQIEKDMMAAGREGVLPAVGAAVGQAVSSPIESARLMATDFLLGGTRGRLALGEKKRGIESPIPRKAGVEKGEARSAVGVSGALSMVDAKVRAQVRAMVLKDRDRWELLAKQTGNNKQLAQMMELELMEGARVPQVPEAQEPKRPLTGIFTRPGPPGRQPFTPRRGG